MRDRHSAKIRRIGDALVAAGFYSLDDQSKALGLPRSTTWTILRANHKKSGLSAAIVTRMLKAPRLPGSVRAKILEYVEAKTAGLYGHSKTQQRRFTNRLKVEQPGRSQQLQLELPKKRILSSMFPQDCND